MKCPEWKKRHSRKPLVKSNRLEKEAKVWYPKILTLRRLRRKDCKAFGLAYNMYEPALVVLQPAEKIRKYFPCRNIVVEGKEREENPYNRYFPVVCLCDFGAIDSSVSKTNERFREDKRKNPHDFPCLEPPKDYKKQGDTKEKKKNDAPLATSKSMASKPGDGKQDIWNKEGVIDVEAEDEKEKSAMDKEELRKK